MSEPASRRKVVAFVLSGIYPGLGQFYNRQPIKGAAFVVASIALSWFCVRALPTDVATLARLSAEPPGTMPFGASLLVAVVVFLLLWIWSVVDAWRVASR